MNNLPKVFIDTAIFRYAAGIKLIQTAKLTDGTITSKDGETRHVTFLVHENIIKEQLCTDENLNREKDAIRKIADIAINNKAYLCYSHEVNLELLFQPEVDLIQGRFHGAPCHIVHSPLLRIDAHNFFESDNSEFPFSFWNEDISEKNSDIQEKLKSAIFRTPINCFISRLNLKSIMAELREIHSLEVNASKLLYPYLLSIEDKRYTEILKQLNAKCVSERKRGNLYMDAYHLWTAEKLGCEYFLTLESALINQFKSSITEAINPSDLMLKIKSSL